MKKVRAYDDIVFEEKNITLPKGSVYAIEEISGLGIILRDDRENRFMIDLDTFEKGFEIFEL